MKSSKHLVEKTEKGFIVKKSSKQLTREAIKEKKTPTNKDIAELLEMVLEKLEGE